LRATPRSEEVERANDRAKGIAPAFVMKPGVSWTEGGKRAEMGTLMARGLWFLGSSLFGVFAGSLFRFSQACDTAIEGYVMERCVMESELPVQCLAIEAKPA
jgi:hypothetical protein